jgi:enoyl-[acyl-carrier protein] reductase II
LPIKTRVTERLGIDAPILQAGMARYTDARLVSAVSNAGGIGILGTVNRELDEIKDEVSKIRELTSRPFGVNIVLAEFDELVWGAVVGAGPALVSTSWGDPREIVKEAHEAGSLVVHQITTVDTAKEAVAAGVDFIIAQGSDGGGHVGWVSGMVLVPQVVDVANGIPVIAAGSIIDGRGLAAALMLGAEGVLVGTRFLATPEAPIPAYWKNTIVEARSESIVQNDVSDTVWGVQWNGATTRTFENRLIRDWKNRLEQLKDRSDIVAAEIDTARENQDPDYLPLYMGQGAGGIKAILPVAEVVRSMIEEAEQSLTGANRFVELHVTSA